MKTFAISATLLALAGCAANTDPQRAAEAEAENPYVTAAATGEARSCIPIRQIKRTEGLSDRAILFEMVGGDLYRNELPTRCPGARRDEAMQYSVPNSQLCRSEIVRFFDPASRAEFGSCGLGDFVPIADPDEPA